ncbi:c-type cytochrome biogenesis protein CcmI [Acerihabitans arboris]|uniref:C-type cytochrome biogenesis protein CcmI n=1 Tax=Acerihabitans arboris TaxID=2691583 RepID=A0A845SRS0_9GAMM|nr:c-type cytochrome biogenesis protein CcmI [Acerihabitans arboris]NDL65338.1 c-type cytochrome biogenesis protein CcmI [Acerihabitans arboris]
MIPVLIVIALLALACALFVLPALRYRPLERAMTRDGLNQAFFKRRLDELAQDEAQGVVAERSLHIEELQQNLLSDIPIAPAAVKPPPGARALLPGAAALVVVTLAFYAWTGGALQVWRWQQTVADLPALRARIMDPGARQLSARELARFAVGLRASLQAHPQNTRDWLILGRIGVVMNNAPMATRAFERAYRLAPGDDAIALDYAEVLTRSADAGDNQEGNRLLQALVRRQPDNIQALNLLAVGLYQQGDYAQSINLWQHVLSLLPAGDAHIDDIRRGIAQARAQSGQETVKLNVTVTLAPALAGRPMPAQGTLFISVTDGKNPVPVAVKTLPLSRFPLSLTLDDSNAMLPERLLSARQQVKVRVRIARDGSADARRGDWFGDSALQDFSGTGRIAVRIDQQMP